MRFPRHIGMPIRRDYYCCLEKKRLSHHEWGIYKKYFPVSQSDRFIFRFNGDCFLMLREQPPHASCLLLVSFIQQSECLLTKMALAIATEKMKKNLWQNLIFGIGKVLLVYCSEKSGDKRSDCPTLGLVNGLVKTGEKAKRKTRTWGVPTGNILSYKHVRWSACVVCHACQTAVCIRLPYIYICVFYRTFLLGLYIVYRSIQLLFCCLTWPFFFLPSLK